MMMMINIYKWLQELKPVLFMIVVQFCFAGINVFYKLAAYDGMSLKVLVAYRFFFAIVFLVPLALIFERKSRPRLTWTILFQAFLCGFFGLEKMGVKTRAGKAKVMGTLLGLGGAMLLTFYKGAEIKMWSTHINLMKIVKPHGGHVASSSGTQILGSLFAIANCFSFSLWLIIQAKMSANYPCPYSSTALMSVMAAIQETTFTLCTERDWTQWKLGWNIRLWSAAYAGIIVHGMMITLVIWCVRLKGPLYTSAFYPLMLVFTALMGPLLLDEYLHVGSILGATLIVCGLYAVLWGKDKEMKKMAQKISKEAETIQTINTSTSDNSENQNRGIIMDKTEEMERKV
eukprot:XP_025015793.1 WAT1-related protein At1g25270 isoform X2 [Ricinus communis]